jgi:hypothetical protein
MGGRHDRDPNGQQYGWIAPDQEVSGHEDEYVNAGGMPKLVYVQSPRRTVIRGSRKCSAGYSGRIVLSRLREQPRLRTGRQVRWCGDGSARGGVLCGTGRVVDRLISGCARVSWPVTTGPAPSTTSAPEDAAHHRQLRAGGGRRRRAGAAHHADGPGDAARHQSRAALSGERVVEVPPLQVPELADDAEMLRRSDAVELFIDRARSAGTDLDLDHDQLETIAEICGRLDGIPLAIELAASRTKVVGPEELLRLGRRLSFLTGGPRDLPARQQTLRSTIACSHDLLDDSERRLFARLGVFCRGLSVEGSGNGVCAPRGHAGGFLRGVGWRRRTGGAAATHDQDSATQMRGPLIVKLAECIYRLDKQS